MSKFDFSPYSLEDDIYNYDGFIDQDGNFYKVKLKNQDKYNEEVTHYTWADKYTKEVLGVDRLRLDPHYSTLYMLSVLRDNLNILVQYYGFIYYSHAHLFHTPIIMYPNGEFGKTPSNRQLDVLWEIMERNKEKPGTEEIFLEDFGEVKRR